MCGGGGNGKKKSWLPSQCGDLVRNGEDLTSMISKA